MLEFLGQAAERLKDVLLSQAGGVFDSPALGQARGHASTGQGRPAAIRYERKSFHLTASREQPEHHGVSAGSGHARVTVEYFKPPMMARVHGVITRGGGKTFEIDTVQICYPLLIPGL